MLLTQERNQVDEVVAQLSTQLKAVNVEVTVARESARQLQQQADTLAREAQEKRNEARALQERADRMDSGF